MKLNTIVKFIIAKDDSGYASDLFGVEPQNDWYDKQYYAEEIQGIIIKNRGNILAQHIFFGDGGIEKRGKIYDISKSGIRDRIKETKQMLDVYGINEKEFIENAELVDFNCFYKIEILNIKIN